MFQKIYGEYSGTFGTRIRSRQPLGAPKLFYFFIIEVIQSL